MHAVNESPFVPAPAPRTSESDFTAGARKLKHSTEAGLRVCWTGISPAEKQSEEERVKRTERKDGSSDCQADEGSHSQGLHQRGHGEEGVSRPHQGAEVCERPEVEQGLERRGPAFLWS